MRINGDIDGNILMIISEHDAYKLMEKLLNTKREKNEVFPMESQHMEVGILSEVSVLCSF